MKVPERLEALKTKMGWSDSQLASRLGVTAPAVTKWRHGSQPRPEILKRLDTLERDPGAAARQPKPPELDGLFQQITDRLSRIEGILLGQRTQLGERREEEVRAKRKSA